MGRTIKSTVRNSKLRLSAKGQDCAVRIPGVCNFNSETTVLAHVKRSGHGKMGGKGLDIHAVYACSACHDAIDGRHKFTEWQTELLGSPDSIRAYLLDAMIETQERMHEAGLL